MWLRKVAHPPYLGLIANSIPASCNGGDRRMLPADARELFLAAGYVVVCIDYRLAPETKLPDILHAVEDAYQGVRKQGPALFQIDPQRVAVVGQSAGAYLALMAGANLHPAPTAVVSFYGYGDIAGEWYEDLYVYYRQNGLWPKMVTGFDPRAEREKFDVYSPQRLVSSVYPPTMLLHGDQDTDVPAES